MIWAILAFLGVPLWLCAAGILVVLANNRRLRTRHGDIPVRVKRPAKKRWTRGHGIWVSDVFAWRGSPAAWNEELLHVADVTLRTPSAKEQHKLHRLGDGFGIARLSVLGYDPVAVAAGRGQRTALLGPFQPTDRSA
jgi:hypothetical protein